MNLRQSAFAIGLLAMSATCFGQVIRLSDRAVVESGQDVRLSDLATVSGVNAKTAEELGKVVIVSGVTKGQKIRAEAVLMALVAQRGGGTGNGLQISGAAECEIVLGMPTPKVVKAPTPPPPPSPAVAVPAVTALPAAAGPKVAAPVGETTTLTKMILARVLDETKAAESDVRVSFQTISPLLDLAIPKGESGKRWLLRPMTRTILGNVQFEAQLVEGQKVLEKLTVQTKIERRQRSVVIKTKLGRGEIAGAAALQEEDAWLDRAVPTLFANARDVAGLEAQRDLAPGTVLDTRDFKPALYAHKNEKIKVVYTAGTLQVQVDARAMVDGAAGDMIQVRNETTGEKFGAVLIAKGLGVAGGTLTPDQEKILREGMQQ